MSNDFVKTSRVRSIRHMFCFTLYLLLEFDADLFGLINRPVSLLGSILLLLYISLVFPLIGP